LSGAEPDEEKWLREDARLAQTLGFDATFNEDVPFFEKPGVQFANQLKFHPRKYLAGLLEKLPGRGMHVFQGTEVTEILEQPLRVKAGGHEVRCRHIVIATHVPLQGLAGTVSAALFQTKLAPYSTYAVGARIPPREVPEASYWDTGDPYNYLRVDRRRGFDYAILGGADHKTGQTRDPQKHYARMAKALTKLIPKARIDYQWSGQVIETPDGLPYIGEMTPGQFIATGFAGNGMTFGTLAGMMACDAIARRKNPWQELFDVHRKKLRGSAWDYLKENKDYPYYFVKDRLTRPAANSLRSVKRGEGRVVQLDGEKVAAYRDEKGKVTLKSAVCTHMGCIVRWNGAEKTWDCPCHGSRFRATGEVLAGPAETPLEDAKAK
jgi:glycine/D-amino acid oxidase-like deaminating enzyme/nitrite reductase/ring-hydroxylating ferredoxin subunit